ncbi:MAG: HD-GYP domain-containing protein [Bacillota bacterium]
MRRTVLLYRYFDAVILLGALVLFRNHPDFQKAWPDMAFFAVLVFLSEAAPIPLPKARGTVSVSAPIIHSLFILHGPAVAGWIAAVGTLRLRDLSGTVPLRIVLFNRTMLALSAVAGAYVYLWLGGEVGSFNLVTSAVPFVAGALTYTLLNGAFAIAAFVVRDGGSPWGIWRLNMRWSVPNLFAFMPMSILIAAVYQAGGPTSVALFFIPLLMARQAFQRYIDMRASYLQTMLALSTALDAKDSCTHGHSERVAKHAVKIGRQLGVSDEDLEILEYVGILHDIGKISIRDELLKKPGLFTAEEYNEMKQHPALGADIIGGIKLLGKGSSWVRHHHERYDGAGFPDGLRGTQIPLGARIITVADSYDAMISERPYKRAYTPKAAQDELVACSGTQFDPVVVQAFLRVLASLDSGQETRGG